MAALTLYDQAYVEVNGKLLAENTSVSTGLVGDDQDVETTTKGFSGITPAPKKRTISLENVVPVAGFEAPWEQWFLDSTEITFRIVLGGSGLSTVSKGFLKKPADITSGVGQTTKMSLEFTGTPSVFA
jgi:hypothetical protein